MADRDINQRVRLDMAETVGQSHGGSVDRQKENRRTVKPGGTVGRDVPDQSKEHNTEIAVEAGHKDGAHRSNRS